jgi:hypothetical protein
VFILTKPGPGKGADTKAISGRHIFLQVLIFIAFFILTVLMLRPLQRGIQARMVELRDGLIGKAEAYLGREITYSSIGPSLFGALDIRNLRISGSGPESLLLVNRFRISYSLWDLLRGKPQAIRSLHIDRPVLSLDLARDRDLINLIQDSFKNGPAFFSTGPLGNLADLLPDTVLFRIRNGQGALVNGPAHYLLQGLNLDLSVENQRIDITGKGSAGFSLAGFFGEPLSLRLAVEIAGSFSSALDEGSAHITVPFLSGDMFRLHALGFDFTLRDQALSLRKSSGGNFDFFLDYGLSGGNFLTRFNCDGFSLENLLSLQGAWSAYKSWLAFPLSGGASLERDSRGNMSYHVGISGALTGGKSPGGSALEISLTGDENYLDLKRLYFSVPRPPASAVSKVPPLRGEIDIQGGIGLRPLAPNGRIRLSDFSLTGKGGLTADLSLGTRGREISVFGETLSLGAVRLSAFDVALIRQGDGLGFSLSALRFTGMETYGEVRKSSLALEGSLDYRPSRVEASLTLDSFSVAALNEMAEVFVREPVMPRIARNIPGDLAVTTEIFLTTDFEHILYNAPRFIIAYRGLGDLVGLISVSGTDQRFDLTEGRIIWADERVLFNGYVDFSSSRETSFSMMINYRDLSYFFEGLLDSRSLDIQGSYGLRANFNAVEGGAFSGTIEAADIPIPFRGQYARLNLQSSLRYESPRFWSFYLDRLEILDLLTPASPGASFRMSGGVDQDGALFPVIVYDDSRGSLNGRALFSWARDFSGLRGDFSVEDEQSQERYALEMVYGEKHLDLQLSVSMAQLGRFLANSYNAQADGDLRLSWDSVNSFRADMNLRSLRARILDGNFRASASAALDHEEFTLRDLHLSYAGLEALMPLFKINRAASRAETEALIRGAAAGRTLDLAFSMDAGFAPSGSWLEFSRALQSLQGAIHVSGARLDTLRSGEPFDFLFSRKGPVLSLSGGPRNMIRLQIDGNGDFYAGFSSPSPIRGSITGTITPKTIEAQTPDLYIDLASLWHFIPVNTDVSFTGGFVSAALEIRGPLGDPEFFGQARGSSLRIQVPAYISQDILPIPFSVAVEGNEMSFGPVPATVGSGAGIITGWFRFDRWIPNIFNMNIQVPSETPIPFDLDITGFLAHGDVSGTLDLSMEDLIFGVTGDLSANNTEIGLDVDEIVRAQGMDMFANIWNPVALDIKVTTGKKVEFLWPNSEFPILQANVDMGTRVNVATDTLARRFSLTSDVKIRSGEIFYFERSFYIRDGSLSFRENEIQFDPRISVRAEVRDRTNDGPVTISMIAENAPLLSFTARFESSPPLSQMEIFALLGQNMTGTSVNESTGSIDRAFMNSTTDFLAQFSVVRRLERGIRDLLWLDMFSVRTQVLQNAVFQAAGLQDRVDRITGVGNYFDNTTVFLGKYIGRDMFVQSMVSLRYDRNRTEMGGLRFEPDIGVELESPFFNIRWDFIPTHLENWYVNDNSITLTWTRSF